MSEHPTYCPMCQRNVLGRRESPSHILHFLVTVLSCGLWVFPWMIITAYLGAQPYLCTVCGSRGENS